MGRPPRPIDPATSPIAAFAYDLRALRDSAGTPSYRNLARRTHYSVTTLSQAAAGYALPTLPVLRVYVAGCGGDPDEWERRWRELAAEIGRPEATRPEPARAGTVEAAPARATVQLSRRAVVAGAGALVLLVAAVIAVFVWRSPDPSGTAGPTSPARLGPADPIADGADPNRAGCGPDAVTLAWTPVVFPAGMRSGKVELRYSPRCAMAWGRFTPDASWQPGAGLVVTVWTIRPADSASQEFTVPYGGLAVIGNMLTTKRGCVSAEVTMAQGNDVSPVATTPCMSFASGLP